MSSPASSQQGLTMIELLVAVLLFAISVVGMTALQTRTMQDSLDTRQRSIALWRANGLIDRMAANNSTAAIQAYSDAINGLADCPTDAPASCSASAMGEGNDCSADDMAEFDVWSELCGADPLDEQLIEFEVALDCAGGCVAGSDLTLTMNWLSKAVDSDVQLRESQIELDDEAMTAATEQIILEFRL